MPFVVGVVARAGVRLAAPGDAEVLVVESRVGVPVAGFLAVVEDMTAMYSGVLCACVRCCRSRRCFQKLVVGEVDPRRVAHGRCEGRFASRVRSVQLHCVSDLE